jgi:hypothetical protein
MSRCIIVVLLMIAGVARAGEIPCGPVEAGTIQIDGLLSDWQGVNGVGVDQPAQVIRGRDEWSGADDLSFDVYCNHDDKHLFMAVNVKDEYFIRSRKFKGDDHVVVLLGRRRLVIYPSNLRDLKGRMTWGRRGKVRGIEMAEAMQTGGYSIELRMPYRAVPGYRHGGPSFPGAVWVADSDSKAQRRTQTIMGTAPSTRGGRLVFAQARAELDSFLRDRGFSQGQIRMKRSADVVGDRQMEQILLVGHTIGIVGRELPGGTYFFLDLPVRQAKDVYWLKISDLNGDGKQELITRYVERSENGRRELIVVYRFNDSNSFVRSFAHEILKGQGKKTIVNRYALKRRKGGVDLIFDRPVAKGFSKDTYREVSCTDCFSILLPWGEEKRRHFRFEGEEYFQK